MQDETTFIFPNCNDAVVEVWEWISNFSSHTILGTWVLIHAGMFHVNRHCRLSGIVVAGLTADCYNASLRCRQGRNPAGTRRNNNVFTTSTRRRVDVVKTLSLRHYCVMCPLGRVGFVTTISFSVFRHLYKCLIMLVSKITLIHFMLYISFYTFIMRYIYIYSFIYSGLFIYYCSVCILSFVQWFYYPCFICIWSCACYCRRLVLIIIQGRIQDLKLGVAFSLIQYHIS